MEKTVRGILVSLYKFADETLETGQRQMDMGDHIQIDQTLSSIKSLLMKAIGEEQEDSQIESGWEEGYNQARYEIRKKIELIMGGEK